MLTIAYVSAAVEPYSQDDLLALLAQSRRDNAAHGVTGCLLYKQGEFMQFLEGEEAEVRQLFENIKRDRRHHCIFQFLDRQTQTAAFGDWSMGFFDLSGASDKVPGYNDFMNRMYTLNEPAAADNAYIRVLQRFRDGVPLDPAQFPDRTDELN